MAVAEDPEQAVRAGHRLMNHHGIACDQLRIPETLGSDGGLDAVVLQNLLGRLGGIFLVADLIACCMRPYSAR